MATEPQPQPSLYKARPSGSVSKSDFDLQSTRMYEISSTDLFKNTAVKSTNLKAEKHGEYKASKNSMEFALSSFSESLVEARLCCVVMASLYTLLMLFDLYIAFDDVLYIVSFRMLLIAQVLIRFNSSTSAQMFLLNLISKPEHLDYPVLHKLISKRKYRFQMVMTLTWCCEIISFHISSACT